MKIYITKIKAIDPKNGEMCTWTGPRVKGISFADAQKYCDENGLGYCEIGGELKMEITTKKDGFTPDWDNVTDYDLSNLN